MLKAIIGGNTNPTQAPKYHICNVCRKESPWTEQHRHVERPIGMKMNGWEEYFVTCSNECRKVQKEVFINWLGKKQGWSLKSAEENYEQTFEKK